MYGRELNRKDSFITYFKQKKKRDKERLKLVACVLVVALVLSLISLSLIVVIWFDPTLAISIKQLCPDCLRASDLEGLTTTELPTSETTSPTTSPTTSAVTRNMTAAEFRALTTELYNLDTNRIRVLTLTLQSMTTLNFSTDFSYFPLFKPINASEATEIKAETYRTFKTLLDNYNPQRGQAETKTTQEETEEENFMTAVLNTTIGSKLANKLLEFGHISQASQMKPLLRQLWFELYSSPGTNVTDTCGFENVFSGELTNSSALGLHSWFSFYTRERREEIDYMGYLAFDRVNVLQPKYSRSGKAGGGVGGMILAVSPEYDLAIYTLGALEGTLATDTSVSLGTSNTTLVIRTDGRHVTAAYPLVTHVV